MSAAPSRRTLRVPDVVEERPLLELAREAMPTVTAVEVALRLIEHAQTDSRSAYQQDADLLAETGAQMLDGADVPSDLGRQLFAQRQHNEVVRLHQEALAQVESNLLDRRHEVARAEVDAGLAVLADQLRLLVDRARPLVVELASVDTAEAAIASGLASQWSQLQYAASRHVELRAAQALLVAGALAPSDAHRRAVLHVTANVRRLVDSYGTVRNFAELYPDGLPGDAREMPGGGARVIGGRVVYTTVTSRALDAPPWLTGNSVQDLAYLAGADAQPWVPLLTELTTARDAGLAKQPVADVIGPGTLEIGGTTRERSIRNRMAAAGGS